MKFLIDECLSAKLVEPARARGHADASHVCWIGKAGAKDWDLLPVILDGDWILVTKNSYDFRGPADAAGARGHYAKAELHAGLVCLNGLVGMNRALQLKLFEAAMDELARDPDLINQVLDIFATEDDDITLRRYAFPPG